MLKPCSLAKCKRQMKHKCGEISSGAAAWQSTGKVDKRCLKDILSLHAFCQKYIIQYKKPTFHFKVDKCK